MPEGKKKIKRKLYLNCTQKNNNKQTKKRKKEKRKEKLGHLDLTLGQ